MTPNRRRPVVLFTALTLKAMQPESEKKGKVGETLPAVSALRGR
jgi:hypothetical protein